MAQRKRTSSSQEVAVFDDVVVPRYRALFGRLITDELPHDARTILNLGCATGRLADRILDSLNSDKGRVVAVDSDDGLIDLARRRGYVETGKRLFFKVEPLESLSFGDEVFDAVVANLIFERTTRSSRVASRNATRIGAAGSSDFDHHAPRDVDRDARYVS